MTATSRLEQLPAPAADAVVRVLATNDLLGTVIPMPTTYGSGGSISGVIELLDRQHESIPTIWVDSGDLTMAGAEGTFGHRPLLELSRLPLAAAAAGNHDLDDGPRALRQLAAKLPFPILCADRDIGLSATTTIDTRHGTIGIIGITHPFTHMFASAPPPSVGPTAIADLAEQLRSDGARWVLALLHNGATWWPSSNGRWAESRAEALASSTGQWADHVDAILGGHTLTAWTGQIGHTPAGHAHSYAASVLPVDLCAAAPYVRIHTPTRVPSVAPPAQTPAVAVLQAASDRVVGQLEASWQSRPGTGNYLPHLVAAGMQASTGADAAFVPASQLFTQAPVDGTVAALSAGAVSALDIMRLHPFDERVAVIELNPGEFRRLLATHDQATDPANRGSDALWWNWARAPAGSASSAAEPVSLAVNDFDVGLVGLLLDREPTVLTSTLRIRQASEDLIADERAPRSGPDRSRL